MYQRSMQGPALWVQQPSGQALNGEAGVKALGWYSFPISSTQVSSVMWFSKGSQIIFGCITWSQGLEKGRWYLYCTLCCIIRLSIVLLHIGLPWWLKGKESICQCRRCALDPGSQDPPEKEIATHSSILTWRIPRTEKSGRLQSMELWKSWTWLSD